MKLILALSTVLLLSGCSSKQDESTDEYVREKITQV